MQTRPAITPPGNAPIQFSGVYVTGHSDEKKIVVDLTPSDRHAFKITTIPPGGLPNRISTLTDDDADAFVTGLSDWVNDLFSNEHAGQAIQQEMAGGQQSSGWRSMLLFPDGKQMIQNVLDYYEQKWLNLRWPGRAPELTDLSERVEPEIELIKNPHDKRRNQPAGIRLTYVYA